jgi:hypothetical protein
MPEGLLDGRLEAWNQRCAGFALLLAGCFVVLDYAALHRRRKEAGAANRGLGGEAGKPAVA